MNTTAHRPMAAARQKISGPRRWLPCLGAALALALLWAAPAPAQHSFQLEDDPGDSRAAQTQPARTVLVKALGQGATPQEAEAAALKQARKLAAEHLDRLGGALALVPGVEGQRIVNVHHFPVMGMAQPRTSVLVELRLRGQAEPLPADMNLPVLAAAVAGGVLRLEATRPCEAVAALDMGKDKDPVLLPGAVQPYRLTPGKAVEQPLPHTQGQTLRVLACTGGLIIPANPSSVDEAFTRARTARPHPSLMQGIVSDCVELRLGQVAGSVRSMRQKGSESPINMTGAAGREGGLPVLDSPAP